MVDSACCSYRSSQQRSVESRTLLPGLQIAFARHNGCSDEQYSQRQVAAAWVSMHDTPHPLPCQLLSLPAPIHLFTAAQVADCEVDLRQAKAYCIKKRLCQEHLTAQAVKRRGSSAGWWRFCQQVGTASGASLQLLWQRHCCSQQPQDVSCAAVLAGQLCFRHASSCWQCLGVPWSTPALAG